MRVIYLDDSNVPFRAEGTRFELGVGAWNPAFGDNLSWAVRMVLLTASPRRHSWGHCALSALGTQRLGSFFTLWSLFRLKTQISKFKFSWNTSVWFFCVFLRFSLQSHSCLPFFLAQGSVLVNPSTSNPRLQFPICSERLMNTGFLKVSSFLISTWVSRL